MPNSQWRDPPGAELRESALGHVRASGGSAERRQREEKQSLPCRDQGEEDPASGVLTPVTTPWGATYPPCVLSYECGTAAVRVQ